MTPTQKLAAAAKAMIDADQYVQTSEHGQRLNELRDALAHWDAQAALNQAARSRLSDKKLCEIFTEEFNKVRAEAPDLVLADIVDQAYLQAARRIAAYADHCHQLLVTLSQTIDLGRLLFTLAEAERRAANVKRIDWDSPSIKPLAEVIGEILSEVGTTEPKPAPVAEPGEHS